MLKETLALEMRLVRLKIKLSGFKTEGILDFVDLNFSVATVIPALILFFGGRIRASELWKICVSYL